MGKWSAGVAAEPFLIRKVLGRSSHWPRASSWAVLAVLVPFWPPSRIPGLPWLKSERGDHPIVLSLCLRLVCFLPRILGSCTSLMQAIQVLIVASKDLQREIVESGRVSRVWARGWGLSCHLWLPRCWFFLCPSWHSYRTHGHQVLWDEGGPCQL